MANAEAWKNKNGTSERDCKCGSWKQHWINNSGEEWPKICSVKGCSNTASLGAHVINASEKGEWIVPTCESCNSKRNVEFDLKGGMTIVPANISKTCDQ
jgi:hypothetical protein